jgi:hypothetical protein
MEGWMVEGWMMGGGASHPSISPSSMAFDPPSFPVEKGGVTLQRVNTPAPEPLNP